MAQECNTERSVFIPCEATLDQTNTSVLGLLPFGYAWKAARQVGTVMYRYWRAVSRTIKWFNDEVCRLTNEFFCSTRNVLSSDYDVEFGIPDPCAPFLSACDVKPIYSARCDDLVVLLAGMGWDAECGVFDANWSCGCASTGCASTSDEITPMRLVLTIHTDTSPIFQPGVSATVGLAATGCSITGCEADSVGTIIGLRCVLDAFLPAHVFYFLNVVP